MNTQKMPSRAEFSKTIIEEAAAADPGIFDRWSDADARRGSAKAAVLGALRESVNRACRLGVTMADSRGGAENSINEAFGLLEEIRRAEIEDVGELLSLASAVAGIAMRFKGAGDEKCALDPLRRAGGNVEVRRFFAEVADLLAGAGTVEEDEGETRGVPDWRMRSVVFHGDIFHKPLRK